MSTMEANPASGDAPLLRDFDGMARNALKAQVRSDSFWKTWSEIEGGTYSFILFLHQLKFEGFLTEVGSVLVGSVLHVWKSIGYVLCVQQGYLWQLWTEL